MCDPGLLLIQRKTAALLNSYFCHFFFLEMFLFILSPNFLCRFLHIKICEKSLLVAGAGKDGVSHVGSSDVEASPLTTMTSTLLSEGDTRHSVNQIPSPGESQKGLFVTPQLHQCKNTVAERSNLAGHEGDSDKS